MPSFRELLPYPLNSLVSPLAVGFLSLIQYSCFLSAYGYQHTEPCLEDLDLLEHHGKT